MHSRPRSAWKLSVSGAVLALAGGVGVSAGNVMATPIYPALSQAVCAQRGGSFSEAPGRRECRSVSDQGTTVYVAAGSNGVEWVQTSQIVSGASAGSVDLGPATVGCARPDKSTSDDWALACQ